MKTIFPLVILLALAGCGKGDNAPGPGGVTVGEARALDDAAEMVEARRMPPAAVGTPAPDAVGPAPPPVPGK